MPTVQFRANGQPIGSPISSPPYTMQWTPVGAGNYTITFEVTYENGTKRTSLGRAVTVKSPVVLSSDDNLLGINIPALGDYFAPYYRDAARQMRPFEHNGQLLPKSQLNASGYPIVANFEVYIWAGAYKRNGRYAITITHPNSYTGGGTLECLGGTLSNISYNNTTKKTTAFWTHPVEADTSVAMLKFEGFTGGITHLQVMRPIVPGSNTTYDTSKLFMDSMVDVMGRFDGARLLDTTGVNSSAIRTWAERTLPTDYSQARDQGEPGSGFGFAGRGMCWEHVAILGNEVKEKYPHFKALWINIPVLADDNYVRQFFTLMRDNLAEGIMLMIEFGNENWNFAPAFIHADYNRAEAVLDAQKPGSPLAYDGDTGDFTLAWRRQAKRTVDFYQIATEVYGANVDQKVQMQLQWQQQNAQATAYVMLKFIDKGLNALNIVGKFGLGGSWYYAPFHHDPTLTINNIWTNNTMNPSTWATEWIQIDIHWVVAYSAPTGKPHFNNYEGCSSFDRVEANEETSQVVADRNNAIMMAANYDSRMYDSVIEHVDMHSQHGGNWRFCYKLGGAHDNQYEWAFIYDHDDFNTPKMNAVAALRARKKAALTYGRLAPFTIPGGQFSITDKGYGEASDNPYDMEPDEVLSYTFRITTAGNYSFSVQMESSSALRLLLGTTTLGNITAPANAYSSPIVFNCPNPGLYSFRVRNRATGTRTIKFVRVLAA